MGIVYEWQVHILCDQCDYWEATSIATKTEWIKEQRKKGWRIGKTTLCPKCSGKVIRYGERKLH